MANWITHTFLAETLLMQGLPLDKRGFCIGNIAPDCNVENADWSVFTPPREVTHWMTGTSKLTSDYEGFYRKYIDNNQLQCSEEFSFFWGYYCHLITDVLYQKFVRDPDRVSACFRRLFKLNSNTVQLSDSPQTFDTLKKFSVKNVFFRILKSWKIILFSTIQTVPIIRCCEIHIPFLTISRFYLQDRLQEKFRA